MASGGGGTIGDIGGEFEFIRRVLSRVGVQSKRVLVGPGDDAAVLETGSRTVVTTDLLLEGRHFRLDLLTPYESGWRAAVASVSDIAAMGACPAAGVVSLGFPPDRLAGDAEEIVRGVSEALEQYGAALVGGDTVQSQDISIINICVLGDLAGEPVLRSGARAGDVVCVTGTLGDSRAGLMLLERFGRRRCEEEFPHLLRKHALPEARVELGRALGRHAGLHAMMDLSDGLASDIRRLCESSGCGAALELARLPVSEELEKAAATLHADPARLALLGGEDFELLCAVDPEEVGAVQALADPVGLVPVGRFTDSRMIAIQREDGSLKELERGFEHFTGG